MLTYYTRSARVGMLRMREQSIDSLANQPGNEDNLQALSLIYCITVGMWEKYN